MALAFVPVATAASPNAAPPFAAEDAAPIAIEPVATAPVPMAIEFVPVACAVPTAMLLFPLARALEPSRLLKN